MIRAYSPFIISSKVLLGKYQERGPNVIANGSLQPIQIDNFIFNQNSQMINDNNHFYSAVNFYFIISFIWSFGFNEKKNHANLT